MPAPTFMATRRIRYSEADPQGVVFNAHYLTYCDDAFDEYLEGIGVDYPALVAAGYDLMAVHADLSWHSSYRPRDTGTIAVTCERVGTTSSAFRFDLSAGERRVATARLTYVGVDPRDHVKRSMPEDLRRVLLGEARAVVETIDLPHSPDEVWAVLREVGDMRWMPGVAGSSLDGDVRTFTFEGPDQQPVVERVLEVDEAGRRYSYEYLSGPMRLASYVAEAAVLSVEGGSTVRWTGRFTVPDPSREDRMAGAIRTTYRGVLEALRDRCATDFPT